MSGTRRRRSTSGYNASASASATASAPAPATAPAVPLPHYTQIAQKKLHPFLFMGCWNYTSPTARGSAARDAVLAMIKTHPERELLVAAGDNAYPEKATNTGIKTFNVEDIGQGFDLLKDSRSKGKLLVGIGNHNAERLNAGDKRILQVERETFGTALPHTFFCRIFTKDHCALIFLDTNAFVKKHAKLNALYEDPDYADDMLQWLEEVILYLKKKRYRYYLVQHEPMFSIKPKGVQMLSRVTDVMDVLNTTGHRPIAILSADTHNHQQWQLDYKGHHYMQVVTGTGGAKPDYVPALETIPINAELRISKRPFTSIRYKTPMHNRIPSYGYLEVVKPGTYDFMAVATEGANFKTDRADDEAMRV